MTNETTARRTVADQMFGDNKAPADAIIAADFATEIAALNDAIAAAQKLADKPIKTDDDLTAVGEAMKRVKAAQRVLEDKRSVAKGPILSAGRDVDAAFKAHQVAGNTSLAPLQKNADTYVRAKQAAERERAKREEQEAREREEKARKRMEEAKSAEAAGNAAAAAEQAAAEAAKAAKAQRSTAPVRGSGATVGARTFWDFTIDDPDKIDLNKLRDFLDPAAIEKAVRAVVKIKKGSTRIDGVRVFENSKANIR